MDNPPAFPTTKPLDGWGDPNQGMTLRDYFAGQAMIALHARGAGTPPDCRVESLSADAYVFYQMADAMLAVRTRAHAHEENRRG